MTHGYSGLVKELAATLERLLLTTEFGGREWSYVGFAQLLGCTLKKAREAVEYVRRNSTQGTITWDHTGHMRFATTFREQLPTRVLSAKHINARIENEANEFRRIARTDPDPVAQRVAMEVSWAYSDALNAMLRGVQHIEEIPVAPVAS